MARAGSGYARIANNWVHDFASGLWAAALFVIWRLHAVFAPRQYGAVFDILRNLAQQMFVWMLVALALIVVTGVPRLLYWRKQATSEEVPRRRSALIAKHVVYVLVYGAGTFWAWTMLR